MTDFDRNKYILDYLINDKTNTALLLNGSWGCGKTFYIQNSLLPYLQENKKKSVYVSMYGIQNIEALSKSIFTESYFKSINNRGGTFVTGLAKTILKGVTNYFNIDISGGTKEWEKLSNIVNLNNKLLIIDDLERHDPSFSVMEILGFINNLCENDKVKVLLVCDENSLIKVGLNEKDFEKYKRIKEKTIGDTILFSPNLIQSIPSIISSFNLEETLGNSNIILKEIFEASLSSHVPCFNLRAVTKSCQKMSEIIKIINFNTQTSFQDSSLQEFLLNVFIGLLFFYLRLSNDSTLVYSDNNQLFSINLGVNNYPLYKFCYEYCVEQKTFFNDFKEAFSKFLLNKKIEEANQDIQIIKSYYLAKDDKLLESLKNLKSSIERGYVPCTAFTGIACFLIAIKYYFHFSIIDPLLKLMIEKIRKNGYTQEIEDSLYSYSGCYFENPGMEKEFCLFLDCIRNNISSDKVTHCKKIQNSTQLLDFIKIAESNIHLWMANKKGFSSHFDFQALIDYIESSDCSPSDIQAIRSFFQHLYYTGVGNLSDFCISDLSVLKDIKKRIETLLTHNFEGKKTTELQLKWLVNNLNDCINNLQGGDACETN